jgi:hypothetical protein
MGQCLKSLKERRNRLELLDGLFTDDDKLLLNPVKDFVRYDQIARSVVLEIVKDHPVEAVTTFTFYKPLYLIRTHLAAMGVESGPPPDFEASYLSATERSSRGLYLNPFRLIPFTVVILCVLILYKQQRASQGEQDFKASGRYNRAGLGRNPDSIVRKLSPIPYNWIDIRSLLLLVLRTTNWATVKFQSPQACTLAMK